MDNLRVMGMQFLPAAAARLGRVRQVASQAFNTDYSYVTRFAGILVCIGVPAEILYYLFETGRGYWDSLPIRIALVAAFASLQLRDWKQPPGWFGILHWESVLFATFPLHSYYQFLRNGGIPYYMSSVEIMFIILGTVTKLWMVPVHWGVGAGAAAWLYFSRFGADPKLVSAFQEALVSGLFCGMVSAAVMQVLESYHRRITAAKLEVLKAQEERAKAAELAQAYGELKKREELIRVFVRPSLVEEIKSGRDPSRFEPVLRDLAILFCDIRGFTRLTEVLSPFEKQTFLNRYFTMMTHPIVENGGEVDKIMGDCVMGQFPDGDCAARAAIAMRLKLQEFNAGMHALGRPKIGNGIGIAKGEVMLGNFGSFEKLDRTVIGEAVNIAARLESKTKLYNVEAVVTEDVIRDLKADIADYRWIDVVQVKGSTRRLKLYEIYAHQPAEVRKYKNGTRDLLEKALTLYFRKGFRDARRMFHAMQAQVPPHRLLPTERMDNILGYYIAHCEAWINHPDGARELIERWDGVHVFHEK